MYGKLRDVLEAHGVAQDAWDVCLIGDGSGQGWDKGIGWACVAIDRMSGTREVLCGGASSGTVNIAELEPYLATLRRDYYYRHGGKLQQMRRVVILSDSQVTVRTGNGEYQPRTNEEMWLMVKFWESRGYQIRWIWVERNQNPLHVLIDRLSKTSEMYTDLVNIEDVYGIFPG